MTTENGNGSQLPAPVAERGISKEQWRTLKMSLYPGAASESVLMVLDYCKVRQLDPMKKPCHIVPMRVKDPQTGRHNWRDVVLPGIYEYRTTAMRSKEYMGHSRPEYGEFKDFNGTWAPEYCDMTIYRWHAPSGQRIEFPVRVYFSEAATFKDGAPNQRWAKAPIQMLTKCAEAAGLREAFPDELGGEMTAEEMQGQDNGPAAPQQATVRDEGPALPTLDDEKFEEMLEHWRDAVLAGQTPDQILAMVESKYALTDDQRQEIQNLNVVDAETVDEQTQEQAEEAEA